MEPRHGHGGFCQIQQKDLKKEAEGSGGRVGPIYMKENGRKVRPKLSINRYRHSQVSWQGSRF